MRIFLIGITGKGMAPLAELAHKQGHLVRGSDNRKQPIGKHLESLGIPIFDEHRPENIDEIDIVVKSFDIPSSNIEIQMAHSKFIPILTRTEMLRKLLFDKNNVISVTGSFGKSTTTTMLTNIFLSAGKSPSYYIGAYVPNFMSCAGAGKGDIAIVEADEYKGQFYDLEISANLTVNIFSNHLDYFKTNDNLIKVMWNFYEVNQLNSRSNVLCLNSPLTQELIKRYNYRCITYGNQMGDWQLENIKYSKSGMRFQVLYKGKQEMNVCMYQYGDHIALNALGCIAIAKEFGISVPDIQKGLKHFKTPTRRFEILYSHPRLKIIDDNARIPIQIVTTIETIKKIYPDHEVLTVCGFWGRFNQRDLNELSKTLMTSDYIYVLELGDCAISEGGAEPDGNDEILVNKLNAIKGAFMQKDISLQNCVSGLLNSHSKIVVVTIGYDSYLKVFQTFWQSIIALGRKL